MGCGTDPTTGTDGRNYTISVRRYDRRLRCVLAANENEDRVRFDAAAEQTQAAHEALQTVEGSLQESFAPLIATFVEEAEKL